MTSLAGAVLLPELKKTIVFKNRDLDIAAHKDELFYDVDCFGIRGIDMATGKHSGLAIGVNHYGLAAANTHVRQSPDTTYDILTEQILMFAKNAEDGLSMVVEHLKTDRKYQWGNLVLADRDSTLVIEIAGSDHSIEWSERKVLRTGHHIMLDTEQSLQERISNSDDLYDDSVRRVEAGYDLLRNVSSVNSVFEMLKDHGDGPSQSSVCRHQVGDKKLATVTSHVVEVDFSAKSGRPKILFHVAQGAPCTTNYTSVPLLFPADEEIIKRAHKMYFK